jgi:hypothetical protein
VTYEELIQQLKDQEVAKEGDVVVLVAPDGAVVRETPVETSSD